MDLIEISDQAFENERVELDGRRFVRCKFKECDLSFSATARVAFEDCTFTRCRWVFAGAASTTLDFLVALNTGLGGPGKDLVFQMLDKLLNFEVKPGDQVKEASPADRLAPTAAG